MKAPQNAICKDDITAIDQLEHWKIVKVNYKALLINNQANNGNITDPGSEFSTKALNCQDILNILEEQSYGHQTGKCLIFNFFYL